MKLYELLQIKPGVTALMGSGGKTSLLYHLAGELGKKHRVLLSTTTHIRIPDHIPLATTAEELEALFRERNVVCAGTPCEDNKITAPSFPGWEQAAEYVLVEADGAKGMPLKAHADYEPVIPASANNTICVVGASGFNQPLRAVCHRPEIYAAILNCSDMKKVSPEMAAGVLSAEGGFDRVFLNQTDTLSKFLGKATVKEFVRALGKPAVAGSLRQGMFYKV
ncbi:MAG: putative selenium-dependent hydroxylase accessory protein YqeC [Oscillospiraceae bacterium]|nr:putative selenium-dependent hydroxylase accessory protein YqeC [Oscillospiraceae bacterium]